jgi:hypothetical protein
LSTEKENENMSLNNRFLTAVPLVVLVFCLASNAQDRANCSNATLHGSYGLHATGSVIGGGDFAAVASSLVTETEILPLSFS